MSFASALFLFVWIANDRGFEDYADYPPHSRARYLFRSACDETSKGGHGKTMTAFVDRGTTGRSFIGESGYN